MRKPPKKPPIKGSRQVRFDAEETNYQDIKEGVYAAIAQLPAEQRNLIPASGTLPEQMVGLALMWLNLPCQAQINSDGGRLRLGGSVVDWLVFLGSKTIAVRVQGDYWHSLPSRKLKDAVQYDRLHFMRYLVADIWEIDLYQAWAENRLKSFVQGKITSAA